MQWKKLNQCTLYLDVVMKDVESTFLLQVD